MNNVTNDTVLSLCHVWGAEKKGGHTDRHTNFE